MKRWRRKTRIWGGFGARLARLTSPSSEGRPPNMTSYLKKATVSRRDRSRNLPGVFAVRHLPRATGCCLLLSALLLLLIGSGCGLLRTAAEIPAQAVQAVTPGKPAPPPFDPVATQQTIFRFADEYMLSMGGGVDALRRGPHALSAAEVLRWKVALSTETLAIASGPNALANLLDMTAFVTVMRMTMEEHWQPVVFGESALPMLESCRRFEATIWAHVAASLTSEHQTELRTAIEAWHHHNPAPENVLSARAVSFTSDVAKPGADADDRFGSVFGLLKMDPFSGLDPALREIAEARLFAERALYVVQRLPMLLRWHTELLSLNALEQPTVQQLVSNSTEIAASLGRFATVAEALPGHVSAEREAIVGALEAQEASLTPLVNDVQQALTAGSEMSASLNTTLTTFDALMQRFGVGETNAVDSASTDSEPFRIQDYGDTAAQLDAAAAQVTELLRTFDQTLGSTNLAQLSAQVGPAVQEVQAGGKAMVDYAFWKGLLLVTLTLLAALLYRLICRVFAGRSC